MLGFEKYNTRLYYFHLNKINLKSFPKKSKLYKYVIFINDRKKETPKLFLHYYFSLIFYVTLKGQLCFITRNLGKSTAQTYVADYFFFINKLFLKKSF